MNWGSATHQWSGTESIPLGMRATVLALSDGKQKFVVVDIDAGGLGGMDNIIQRAAARTGIPADHIRLGVSHTHSGPSLSQEKVHAARISASISP